MTEDTEQILKTNTNTVWKFQLPLEAGALHHLPIPAGSKILTVASQASVPCIWVQVNPSEDTIQDRLFKIVGTGHAEVFSNDTYIGSCQTGVFVWHIYEVGE